MAAPDNGWCVLAGQGSHVPVTPSNTKPGAQGRHEVAPRDGWWCPGGQGSQVAAPDNGWCVLAGQGSHNERPSDDVPAEPDGVVPALQPHSPSRRPPSRKHSLTASTATPATPSPPLKMRRRCAALRPSRTRIPTTSPSSNSRASTCCATCRRGCSRTSPPAPSSCSCCSSSPLPSRASSDASASGAGRKRTRTPAPATRATRCRRKCARGQTRRARACILSALPLAPR